MKVIVKDLKGDRIVTEIKRPDPEAVLVLKEGIEFDLSNIELFRLVHLAYVNIKDVLVDGKKVVSVYPDSITFAEEPKTSPEKIVDVPKQKPAQSQSIK